MSAINPENPLVSAVADHWHKIAGFLIWKFKQAEVVLTAKDLEDFAVENPDCAVMLHEKADGLHIMLVTAAQGRALAAQERVRDATPPAMPVPPALAAPAPFQSSLTTDPMDPRLGHGVDESPVPQNDAYLVLSEEERAKGFTRPLRRSYRHVGERPVHPTRPLTVEEEVRFAKWNYVAYEVYPEGSALVGRFWTEAQLKSGCGETTTMGLALCETYARNPKFYGSTYCCSCQMHRPVAEFVWTEDGAVVGS